MAIILKMPSEYERLYAHLTLQERKELLFKRSKRILSKKVIVLKFNKEEKDEI